MWRFLQRSQALFDGTPGIVAGGAGRGLSGTGFSKEHHFRIVQKGLMPNPARIKLQIWANAANPRAVQD